MKIISLVMIVMLLLSMPGFEVKALFITQAGVKISYRDYEDLKKLGIQDYEIQLLPESSINNYLLISKEYRTVFLDINYIQERAIVVDGVETLEVNELSKDEYDLRINSDESSLSFRNNDLNTSLMSSYSATKTDTYKTMMLSGSYSEITNQYFVRLTVKWDRLPLSRLHDVLAITHMDSVVLNMKYVNGFQQPNYAAKILYTQNRFDSRTGGLSSQDISKTINLNYQQCATTCFRQSLNGILSVQNLPNDSVSSYYNSDDGYYVYGYIVKTILHSVEGYFVPRTLFSNPEPFHGGFKHMTSDQFYSFGNLTVSYAPPYISYTPNFGIINPSYDIELETQINIFR